MKETWRDNIENYLKKHLELQIIEASKHSGAYSKSSNPSNAQLWVAIANLSKQLFETNLRIKFLEKTLHELTEKMISLSLEKSKRMASITKKLKKRK